MTINPPNTNDKAQVRITSLSTDLVSQFFPYDFEFDDIFRPEWGTYEGFGRMDPVMTYKRTSRTATLSFNVVAENKEQAENNFNSLQLLILGLYPTYKPLSFSSNENVQQSLSAAVQNRSNNLSFNEEIINQGLGIQQVKQEPQAIQQQITNINTNIAEQNSLVETFGIGVIDRSPLFKINFMNLLNNDEYVIAVTNFKHKMKFDAADTSLDRNGKVIPGEFNINMSFTILHTYVPGTKINYNLPIE
jgi:predicted  nucleic acid-binding Zn-ribbon protein